MPKEPMASIVAEKSQPMRQPKRSRTKSCISVERKAAQEHPGAREGRCHEHVKPPVNGIRTKLLHVDQVGGDVKGVREEEHPGDEGAPKPDAASPIATHARDQQRENQRDPGKEQVAKEAGEAEAEVTDVNKAGEKYPGAHDGTQKQGAKRMANALW